MELISKQKIEEEVKKDSLHDFSWQLGFLRGVEFAEQQLQDLAVEFAEWCEIFYYYFNCHTKKWYHFNAKKKYTTKELFELFLKERNEKKTTT